MDKTSPLRSSIIFHHLRSSPFLSPSMSNPIHPALSAPPNPRILSKRRPTQFNQLTNRPRFPLIFSVILLSPILTNPLQPPLSSTLFLLCNPLQYPDPKQAKPANQKRPNKKSIAMRIDSEWYDCSGWAKAHPGGAPFVEYFDGRDATDAFYALHSYGPNGSDEALARLRKLPKLPEAPENAHLVLNSEVAAKCEGFRDLRQALEKDGWFDRDPLLEALYLLNVVGLSILGTALAWTGHPWGAILALGLGMQQAGWLGHDYIHGRGWWCSLMRATGGFINGHSVDWWVQKHSRHHSFTNEVPHDAQHMLHSTSCMAHDDGTSPN